MNDEQINEEEYVTLKEMDSIRFGYDPMVYVVEKQEPPPAVAASGPPSEQGGWMPRPLVSHAGLPSEPGGWVSRPPVSHAIAECQVSILCSFKYLLKIIQHPCCSTLHTNQTRVKRYNETDGWTDRLHQRQTNMNLNRLKCHFLSKVPWSYIRDQ